jgi:hypothetical protein
MARLTDFHQQLVRIRATEANEKLFFMQANGRRRKNKIQLIVTDGGTKYQHEDIAAKLYKHFSTHFGRPAQRDVTLLWSELRLNRRELSHLEVGFSEEEVHMVIQDLEADKAPGPDGFIGVFLKHSWQTIKVDLMNAIFSSTNSMGSILIS